MNEICNACITINEKPDCANCKVPLGGFECFEEKK